MPCADDACSPCYTLHAAPVAHRGRSNECAEGLTTHVAISAKRLMSGQMTRNKTDTYIRLSGNGLIVPAALSCTDVIARQFVSNLGKDNALPVRQEQVFGAGHVDGKAWTLCLIQAPQLAIPSQPVGFFLLKFKVQLSQHQLPVRGPLIMPANLRPKQVCLFRQLFLLHMG